MPLVEQHTGVCFGARAVELCVLRGAAPHGIRVTGTRFLADLRYDTGRVLDIAVHELLHPPWPKHHPVKSRLDALAGGPFLAARFAARDPATSYNTWASYAEEDAAQALDQYLNTQLGRNTRGDPATRWTTADGGMYVLALLLHDTLQRGGFDLAAGSYADFLARALSDRHTWPGDLHARYLELTAATKDQLVAHVRSQCEQATGDAQSECERVIGTLTRLPDQQYSRPTDVSKAFGEIARETLTGADYPASRDDLVEYAREQDADTVVHHGAPRDSGRGV